MAGVWGCPPTLLRTSSVLKAGVQRAQPHWQVSGGVPQPFFVLPRSSKRESRGRRPLAGVWGCPPTHLRTSSVLKAGVQRAPPWQVSGGVPQPFFVLPRSSKRESRGRRPLAGVWGCSPTLLRTSAVHKAGVQRAPPFGRSLGVFPNPALYFRGPESGSPEGAALWQESGGVPQRPLLSSPFLPGRGPGGWSEPPLRQHSPKRENSAPPPPQIASLHSQ